MINKTKDIITNIFVSMTAAVFTTLFTLGLFLLLFSDIFGTSGQLPPKDLTPTPTEQASMQPDKTPEKIVEIVGYEDIVIPIAQKLKPSIVGVRVVAPTGINQILTYEASGVIYTEDGYIITNHHVLSDVILSSNEFVSDATVEVFVEGQFQSYEAKLIGFDSLTDLALIKIDADNLVPANFGDSLTVQVGQMVVAIGSPGGLEFMGSVSQGIISGIDRMVEFEDGTIMQLIQTDAAVNPGNSGGALVNSSGDVIGINNAGLEKATYEGINFAIPSNLVLEVIEDIKNQGYVTGRSWLGVYIMSDVDFESVRVLYDLPQGVFVTDLDESGPAYIAGIRKNDVIVEFNNIEIDSTSKLRQALNETNPGEEYIIIVYRPLSEEEQEFTVVLGERN